MASSVTTISTTNSISTTAAVALIGPTKIVIKGATHSDEVYIYEETGTEGAYQQLKNEGVPIRLDFRTSSLILEGYGNYKFLLGPNTATGLVVGYAA